MVAISHVTRLARGVWIRLWMPLAGIGPVGRLASWMASLAVPPFYGRLRLANLCPRGFVAPSARIHHQNFRAGSHPYLDDRVLIYASEPGGRVTLGDEVRICRDTIIETGADVEVAIGDQTFIQPRCHFGALHSSIRIGRRVQIASSCAFYAYDHGIAPGQPIWGQALTSRGDIVVEDDAWLGYGVVVLSGVTIGSGAVVGASAVVTHDVPAGAIVAGNPARLIGTRDQRDVRARPKLRQHG